MRYIYNKSFSCDIQFLKKRDEIKADAFSREKEWPSFVVRSLNLLRDAWEKSFNAVSKSARSNGNVVHDISPGILTDDHRDDLVPSLFEEIFVERGEEQIDGRHGRARKKRRFVEVATGRNGLRRKIHPEASQEC